MGSLVILVVSNNWDNNYNGFRQGYSIYAGSQYVKYIENKETEYALYDLDVKIINVRFRGDKNHRFKTNIYITSIIKQRTF